MQVSHLSAGKVQRAFKDSPLLIPVHLSPQLELNMIIPMG